MERRREYRVVVRGTGKLSWTEGRHTRTEFVEVQNVAGDGVRIRLLTPLRVPQLVRLSGLRYECDALVRYCRRDDTEWTAGLQVTSAADSTLPVKYGF
jgi:hypothetical protein